MIHYIKDKIENFSYIKQINDLTYEINFNYEEEFEDEKVFQKSAFVKTGKKVKTGNATWLSIHLNNKPSVRLIKHKIKEAMQHYIESKILNGFVWKGYNVWLSKENQQNYANWYNFCKNSYSILPLTAKFMKNGKTIYYEFTTIEELENFYGSMIKFINESLNKYRKALDTIDYKNYVLK